MSRRLLLISNLFPPHVLGGYEILCGQVARAFAARGWEVEVLTTNHGLAEGESETTPWEGIPVTRSLRLFLPFGQAPVIDRKVRQEATLQNRNVTKAFLVDHKPDVVFVWSLLRATVGPARAAQELGVPTAFSLNDANIASYLPAAWNRPHRAFPDRMVFRESTLDGLNLFPATCISNAVRDDLLAAGVPVSDARTIYQGVPISEFPLKPLPGDIHRPMQVLYAGQLHDYKGVEDVVEAVRRVGNDVPIHLRIAGKGDAAYEESLRQAAEGLHVEFLGRLDRAALGQEYARADVFIFPSRWREPFGLTHLEAMACGTPVISTAEGGPAEFLKDRQNALVVPTQDPDAIAAALREIAVDDALRHSLALAGRALVETEFNLDRYVGDLEYWLEHSVMDRPRPSESAAVGSAG